MTHDPNPDRRPRPRPPWGLVGMIALVCAAERYAARHDHWSSTVALSWRAAGKAASAEAPRCEVLCLGSSMLKFGALPRLIEAETGRAAYNLAACSADTAATYYVFRRALRAGARPRAVLVDCLETPIPRGNDGERRRCLRVNQRLWPELVGPRTALELAAVARDPDFLVDTLAARLLPSYKTRHELRAFVRDALRGSTDQHWWTGLLVRRNWKNNRGAQVMLRDPAFEAAERGQAVRTPPQGYPADRWERSRLQLTYTRRLLDLAAAHGVRVFWLVPPVSPREQEAKNRVGVAQYHTDFLRSVQRSYPNLTVIDGRAAGFPPDAFFDVVHLNQYGARAFTAQVAAVLKRYLDAPAPARLWVNLPPYRPTAPARDPRLETLEETSIALRAATFRP